MQIHMIVNATKKIKFQQRFISPIKYYRRICTFNLDIDILYIFTCLRLLYICLTRMFICAFCVLLYALYLRISHKCIKICYQVIIYFYYTDTICYLVKLLDDHGDEDSMQVLNELEKIDDDCDKHGIQFVKIDDDKAAKDFGIDSLPAIVYFEKQIPNLYDGG